MGFLDNLFKNANKALRDYSGDKDFLNSAVAAAANVIAADGQIDDTEIDAAIGGMKANAIISKSYTPSQIENALMAALQRAKTRFGRNENKRAIEDAASRPLEDKQDIFLICADIADDGGIGKEEMVVLESIAAALGLDAKKLLG